MAEPVLKKTDHRTLYEQDLVAWFDDTVARLKVGKFHEVDIESLIEEVEGLAGRDRRELKSRLRVLLAHLLKRIYVRSSDSSFSKCWTEALAGVSEDYPQTEFPQEWELNREIDALLSEKFW